MLRPLLVLTFGVGTLVAPLPTRHELWIGTAVGEHGSTMRGDFEMFAARAPNTTFAELSQRNDVPGAVRTWRVRHGTCAKPGRVFGDSTAFPVIRIGRDGKGVGAVTLRLAVPDTGDFHVAVGASPRDSRRLACGDLVLED